MGGEHLLERQAAHEFHPETGSPVVFTSPVHGDDVRVTHASQRSPFVQQSGYELRVSGSAPQELDGDGAIELRVVSAIDSAERAVADLFDQDEIAPPLTCGLTWSLFFGGPRVRSFWWVGRLRGIIAAPVHAGYGRNDAKLLNETPLCGLRHPALDIVPVDSGAVRHGGGQIEDRILVRRH
jgi:hypothetical protein